MMRLPSAFRRPHPEAQAAFDDSRALVKTIERRTLLRGGLSLGALTMLTGCDVSNTSAVQTALQAMSQWNDRVQAVLFNPDKLAPTYGEADVVRPPRFNAFYTSDQVKPVDGSAWRLELAGLIGDKRAWTSQDLAALPEQELIIRHICVEGWDYIGQWSGVNLRGFLQRIGADLSARFVGFRCADGYTSSIDMATALHPQTILATKYAKSAITDPYGYPLRLRTSTKLGFKNPKWITAIEVTNTNPGGYWEDRGYNWFSGL